jgi:hypothetical protein
MKRVGSFHQADQSFSRSRSGIFPEADHFFVIWKNADRDDEKRSRARWTSAGTLDLPEKGEDPLPARRKSMRKIKEVLHLFHEVGLGQREVARCVQLAPVHGS